MERSQLIGIFWTSVVFHLFKTYLAQQEEATDNNGRFVPQVTEEDKETCSDIRFDEISEELSNLSLGYKDWMSQTGLTWPAAMECCALHNYELISIVAPSTRRKYIKLPPEGAWVNANDMINEGGWSWPVGGQVNAESWDRVAEGQEGTPSNPNHLEGKLYCARMFVNEQNEVTLKDDTCSKRLSFVCRERVGGTVDYTKINIKYSVVSFTRNMTKWELQSCKRTSFIKLGKHEFLSKSKLPWIAAHKCCEFWYLSLLPPLLYPNRDMYRDKVGNAWVGGKDLRSSHRFSKVEKCTLLRNSQGQMRLMDYNCKVSNSFICQGKSERVKGASLNLMLEETPEDKPSTSSQMGRSNITLNKNHSIVTIFAPNISPTTVAKDRNNSTKSIVSTPSFRKINVQTIVEALNFKKLLINEFKLANYSGIIGNITHLSTADVVAISGDLLDIKNVTPEQETSTNLQGEKGENLGNHSQSLKESERYQVDKSNTGSKKTSVQKREGSVAKYYDYEITTSHFRDSLEINFEKLRTADKTQLKFQTDQIPSNRSKSLILPNFEENSGLENGKVLKKIQLKESVKKSVDKPEKAGIFQFAGKQSKFVFNTSPTKNFRPKKHHLRKIGRTKLHLKKHKQPKLQHIWLKQHKAAPMPNVTFAANTKKRGKFPHTHIHRTKVAKNPDIIITGNRPATLHLRSNQPLPKSGQQLPLQTNRAVSDPRYDALGLLTTSNWRKNNFLSQVLAPIPKTLVVTTKPKKTQLTRIEPQKLPKELRSTVIFFKPAKPPDVHVQYLDSTNSSEGVTKSTITMSTTIQTTYVNTFLGFNPNTIKIKNTSGGVQQKVKENSSARFRKNRRKNPSKYGFTYIAPQATSPTPTTTKPTTSTAKPSTTQETTITTTSKPTTTKAITTTRPTTTRPTTTRPTTTRPTTTRPTTTRPTTTRPTTTRPTTTRPTTTRPTTTRPTTTRPTTTRPTTTRPTTTRPTTTRPTTTRPTTTRPTTTRPTTTRPTTTRPTTTRPTTTRPTTTRPTTTRPTTTRPTTTKPATTTSTTATTKPTTTKTSASTTTTTASTYTTTKSTTTVDTEASTESDPAESSSTTVFSEKSAPTFLQIHAIFGETSNGRSLLGSNVNFDDQVENGLTIKNATSYPQTNTSMNPESKTSEAIKMEKEFLANKTAKPPRRKIVFSSSNNPIVWTKYLHPKYVDHKIRSSNLPSGRSIPVQGSVELDKADEIQDIESCKSMNFTSLTEYLILSHKGLPWKTAEQCCEWLKMHLLYGFDVGKINTSNTQKTDPIWLSKVVPQISTKNGMDKYDLVYKNYSQCEALDSATMTTFVTNCDNKYHFVCQEYKSCHLKTEVEIPQQMNLETERTRISEENILALRLELRYLKYQLPGPKPPEEFQPYQYLQFARKIFSQTCPAEFVPESLVRSVSRIFRYFLALNYDNYHSNRGKPIDKGQHQRIMDSLTKCYENSDRFEIRTETRREKCDEICQPKEFFEKNKIFVFCNCYEEIVQIKVNSTYAIDIARHPLKKQNLGFDLKKLDFVVEFIWKIILFTHFFCAHYFEPNYVDFSLMINELEDLFDSDIMTRWKNTNHRRNDIWDTFFLAYSLESIAKSVDSCLAAAISLSKYRGVLKRPIDMT